MSLAYSFDKTPDDLVEYIKAKKPQLHFDYDEIMHEAHHKAFTVAKVTKLDLLTDIQESLQQAINDGIGFKEWQKNIKPTLQKKGWWGEVEVTNPTTGEVKNIYVGSNRLKNIFDTNIRVAYAQGRYKSQMESEGEYFYYSAILDSATRPKHAALHGTILPKNHPWWDTNYPPNAWRCRCKVRVYTIEELKRRGMTPTKLAPPNIAHKDWSYHVGKTDNIKQVYKEKIQSLTCKSKNSKGKSVECRFLNAIKDEFKNHDKTKNSFVRQKQLDDMVDEVIVKKNQKYKINAIEVGELSKKILQEIKNHLNKDIKEAGVLLEKKRLLHARPERKAKYNQALRVDEIRTIAKVLEDEKEVYIDIDHQNIVYAFDDRKDETKINKLVVNLNHIVKKFGTKNVVLTFSKVNRSEFDKANYIKTK